MMSGSTHVAVVVAAGDQLDALARAAVSGLGDTLRDKSAVVSASKRFGRAVVADPSSLRLEALDVVSYSTPDPKHPHVIAPIVIFKGKPTFVDRAYEYGHGEYWLLPRSEVASARSRLVRRFARQIAVQVFLEEALSAAVDAADIDDELTAIGCSASDLSVSLYPDPAGAIAKRLPKWITVEGDEETKTK